MADYTLSAEIVPTLSRSFSRDVQKQIKEALAKVDATAKIKAQVSVNAVQVRRAVADAAKGAEATIKAQVAVSAAQIRREVNRAAKEAGATINAKVILSAKQAKIQADIDTKTAQAKLDNLVARTKALNIKADVDDANAKLKIAKIADIQRKIDFKPEIKDRDKAEFENEVSALAKRANFRFNAIALGVAFAGLPAAATIAGAGVVAGLSVIPAAFAAIGVAAVASTAEVTSAFAAAKSQIGHDFQALSAPLVSTVVDAIDRVKIKFSELKPSIAGAVQSSAPAISILTDAVTGFATRAMPGLLVGVNNSITPLRGLRDLFYALGRGFTDFVANLSTGAAGSQRILGNIGNIFQDFLGFAGKLFANLSNNGNPVLVQFRTALQQVESVLLQVTTAGSALYSAFSGVITAISGGLGVFQGLLSILDALPGGVTKFGGELIVASRLMNAFGLDITSGFNGVGKAINDAKGGVNKFKEGIGGLAAGAFSPVTLAAGILTIGLGLLGDAQQKAAQKAAEHKAQQDSFREALAATNGVIDESIRKTVAKKAEEKGAAENTRALGLGQTELINALVNGGQAADDYTGRLRSQTVQLANMPGLNDDMRKALLDSQQQFVATGGSADQLGYNLGQMTSFVYDSAISQGKSKDEADRLSKAWENQVTRVLDLSGQYNELGGDFKKAAVDQNNLNIATGITAKATETLSYSQLLAKQSSKELAADFTALGDTAKTAADKGKILQDVLDKLNGRVPSYEEAQQNINDQIRAIGDNFKDAKDKAEGYGKALINADGTVNTTTKNGSFLQNTLVALEKGFADSGVAIDDLVKSGVPLGKATAQVNKDLATQRQRFIDAAGAAGLTKQQATELADKYGLIPKEVTTTFTLAGATTAQAALDIIQGQIVGVTGTKEATFKALTAEAEQKLTALGYNVTHLPDGTVKVFANTAEAEQALTGYVIKAETTTATTTVFGNTNPAVGAVKNWKDTTTQTTAATTTYTHTDPATHAVTQWVFDTATKRALTTTFTNTDPATGQVNHWLIDQKGKVLRITMEISQADLDKAHQQIADLAKQGGYAVFGAPTPGGGTTAHRGETGRAGGGWIWGPGTSTSDSIPARLSTGEFVVRAAAAQQNGPLLEAINSGHGYASGGWVQHFANGGTVAPAAGTAVPAPVNPALLDPALLDPALIAALAAAFDHLAASVAGYNVTALAAGSDLTTVVIPALAELRDWLAVNLPNANAALMGSNAALRSDEQVTASWAAQQWSIARSATEASVAGQRSAHEGLKTSLALVRTAFSDTANWATAEFSRTKGAATGPIRDIVNGAINNGLIAAWNSLDGQFHFGQHINPVSAAFAAGGHVSGPGTSTSDSIPAWLSNGEYVVKADMTAKYKPLLDQMNAGRFADGGLVGDFTGGAFDKVEPRIMDVIHQYPGNVAANAGAGEARRAVDKTKSHFTDKFNTFAATSGSGGGAVGGYGAGVQQWAPLVLQVLGMLGQPASLLPNVLRRMNQESGGNPTIGNFWDSNAAKGTPSMGLMQVIGPTFAAYAGPFRGLGLLNPLANIYAGLNYALHRYPSLQYAMDKPGGYHDGGVVPGTGYRDTVPAVLTPGEAVLTPTEKNAYQIHANELAKGDTSTMRLDQHSINRLAAAILAAAERRPNVVNVSGIGLTGGGI